jgi:meso-butanediol dehydrogenase/(S,S)-butanediol dehydrogenase/diacetyl reductase
MARLPIRHRRLVVELKDAVVIVTGGARGIGRGIVTSFAAEGAHVVIGDLLDVPDVAAACDETRRIAEAQGVKSDAIPVDVRDAAQCEALVRRAVDRFGRLDVVCANAGVVSTGLVADLTPDEWDRVMDVNAKGVFLTCRAAIPVLTQQRRGCFVNTASIAGKRGAARVSHYVASKFAVVGFTQSLAMEMAPHNVRANAICPGYLGTHMWLDVLLAGARDRGENTRETFERLSAERVPLGRPQTTEDIGQAAVYLARADNVTGVALNVAGGLEMH